MLDSRGWSCRQSTAVGRLSDCRRHQLGTTILSFAREDDGAVLVSHKARSIGRVCHLLRVPKIYAKPVGNRLDHETAQDVTAG